MRLLIRHIYSSYDANGSPLLYSESWREPAFRLVSVRDVVPTRKALIGLQGGSHGSFVFDLSYHVVCGEAQLGGGSNHSAQSGSPDDPLERD